MKPNHLGVGVLALSLVFLGPSGQALAGDPVSGWPGVDGETFWNQATFVLGDVVRWDENSVTLRVVDQLGDAELSPGAAVELAIEVLYTGQGAVASFDGIEFAEGLRLLVPAMKRDGRLIVPQRNIFWLNQTMPLPAVVSRNDLEGLRRVKAVFPDAADPKRLADYFSALGDSEPWVRQSCLEVIRWHLLGAPVEYREARARRRGLDYQAVLDQLLEMATDPKYTGIERLVACRMLAENCPGMDRARLLESLRAILADPAATEGEHASVLYQLDDLYPDVAIPILMATSRDRRYTTGIREIALRILAGFALPGNVRRVKHDPQTWAEHVQSVVRLFLELAEDEEAGVRGEAVYGLIEVVERRVAPPSVLAQIEVEWVRQRIAAEPDSGVRSSLQVLEGLLTR